MTKTCAKLATRTGTSDCGPWRRVIDGKPGAISTHPDAPHAGHTAMIAGDDQRPRIGPDPLANGIGHIALTARPEKSATDDMKDLEIEHVSRRDLVVAIRRSWADEVSPVRPMPGRLGISDGSGAISRYGEQVVLAGAPIHTDAGNGPIKRMAHESPVHLYEELVALGGGPMKGNSCCKAGKICTLGSTTFRTMSISTSISTTRIIWRRKNFESWYENPIDLPGRWYLQVITQIFKENRLAKGKFIGLGRQLNLRDITCAVYLLAGSADDDITTPEQVLDATKYLGAPKDRIVQKTVPGGHIGLFMGARTLKEHWPPIARWIAAQ